MALAPLTFGLILALAGSPALAGDPPRNPRWAKQIKLEGADNFYRVTPRLYRAAQPSVDAFRAYEDLGIETVINLRANSSNREKIRHTSLRLIEVPINTWSLSDDHVLAVLSHIKNEPGPIVVHCQHGADRTGAIIAMYRIIFQDWSKEEALDEMVGGGYGYHRMWTNLPKYIRQADLNKIRASLGCPPRGPCASEPNPKEARQQ